ncbi:SMUG2 DNA glycosylase family protein [Owenweeksia hongkongensis]|uniref:SMUG2 DNA glycosylase family protein n=1 Tax=Owenweeksia hongkongensis TaxID=253245 RepID=UPI003A8FFF52
MTKAEQILDFYSNLNIDVSTLPLKVDVLNPYQNPSPEMEKVLHEFYHKYYGDTKSRGLILGINPGRFGAGITGIPFTDSYRLKEFCDIDFPIDTRETSSVIVYEVIQAFGGAKKFYSNWFIGATSPLGFIHQNAKGNWVNYNYYDDPKLEKAVRPFIIDKLQEQLEICGNPRKCVVLGTGKNYKYLQKLNKEIQLFDEIVPLEHPRYIMQYKLKSKEDYVTKFLGALS